MSWSRGGLVSYYYYIYLTNVTFFPLRFNNYFYILINFPFDCCILNISPRPLISVNRYFLYFIITADFVYTHLLSINRFTNFYYTLSIFFKYVNLKVFRL